MDGSEPSAEPQPVNDPHALLESVHSFPGPYQFKVIGTAYDDFVARVVGAVGGHLETLDDLVHRVRETPGGRHVAVTLELHLRSAAQVQAIYDSLRQVEGITMLL